MRAISYTRSICVQVRESLSSSVSQLQDELHSKCEELGRAQLKIQQMQRESTSLKQV